MKQYNPPNNQQVDAPPTEERILLAAEEEFLAKGYAGARTTAIAEAAGVTHAMLHYYFRTKEKLFSRVLSDKLEALVNTFIISIDADTSLDDCLRRAVDAHFDFVMANPTLPRFMISEVFPNPSLRKIVHEKIKDRTAETIRILQEKIDIAAARGECREMPAISVLMSIISLNIFPVLSMPVWSQLDIFPNTLTSDSFLHLRREENIRIILQSLKPLI